MNNGRVRLRMRIPFECSSAWVLAGFLLGCAGGMQAQGPVSIPLINVGGDATEAQFARLDFAQKLLEEQARDAREKAEGLERRKKLVASGTVSALDLAAPGKAVSEFNKAASLLSQQHSKEAILHLRKAIATYPKFVSAHNNLGLAYMDLEDSETARSEFETAAKLDDKFPGSFLNLGRLALMQKDFPTAESDLEKAASLQPRNANVLTALAYAQNSAQHYRRAIDTAGRVHALEHKGLANVHYVAASAAVSLDDFQAAQRELEFFVHEDPSHPLAPTARYNLEVLARRQNAHVPTPVTSGTQPAALIASSSPQTFPNTARLKDQLTALGDESADASCADCGNVNADPATPDTGAASAVAASSGERWTIRKNVDEVAVFFSVTNHGHFVEGLEASDIQVRDDHKPPLKVLQFASSSDLPLRLGLLVDTSGSVNRASPLKSAPPPGSFTKSSMLPTSGSLRVLPTNPWCRRISPPITSNWPAGSASSRIKAARHCSTRCLSPAGSWLPIRNGSGWRGFWWC